MVKILLDFPWRIDSVLDPGPDPDPRKAIRDYEQFRARIQLKPVAFIVAQEEGFFWERLGQRKPHGSWMRDVLRFIAHHRTGRDAGAHRAILVNGPNDLQDFWQRSLREEMGDLNNWRTPQIIVCSERWSKWRKCVLDDEVEIALEGRPADDTQKRVVVFVGSYEQNSAHKYEEDYRAHKYAVADVDPWDVRHCNQPNADGLLDSRCRLPRPSNLNSIAIPDLDEVLRSLRSESWPHEGKYWFIPPASWNHLKDKDKWRKGSFEEKTAPNGRKGPIDYKNQIWSWHQEGHWDVQLKDGKHVKVKSNGDPWK